MITGKKPKSMDKVISDGRGFDSDENTSDLPVNVLQAYDGAAKVSKKPSIVPSLLPKLN